MGIDRVKEWNTFSDYMSKYIQERTIEKYIVDEKEGFDLMSISKPEICIWNILRYALRIWNGKTKSHDLEKIAHYAEMAWSMNNRKDPTT